MILPAATPATTAFLSGSAGTGEWLLLFGVILVLFGPRRLPEIARTVGRWMMEARRAANEFRDQVMSIDVSVDNPPRPSPPPPAPGAASPGAAGAVHRGATDRVAASITLPASEHKPDTPPSPEAPPPP